MAVVLLALLINQQADLHSAALRAGSDLLESRVLPVQSPLVLATSVAVLASAAAVTALVTLWTVRQGGPPGVMAMCGLGLIAVHGLARGAKFLHITNGTWIEAQPVGWLQVVEALGVALIVVGILRFEGRRPAEIPTGSDVPDDPPRVDAPTPSAGGTPRRRRLMYRVLAVTAVFGVLALTGLYLGHRAVGGIDTFADPFTDLTDRPPKAAADHQAAGEDPMTLLLLGSDVRNPSHPKPSWEEGGRADTIMLLNLPSSRDAAYLVSIPRESWVQIPGHGMERMNTAYARGGPALMVQTIESVTNVRIDHVAVLDFSSFATLTDAMGGVEMTVPADAHLDGRLIAGAGTYVMDGRSALAYVSQNSGLEGGDLDRIPRQQEWLRAMAARVTDPSIRSQPWDVLRIISTVTGSLTVDEGLGLDDLARLVWGTRDLRPADVTFLTAPLEPAGSSPDGSHDVATLDHSWIDELSEAVATDTMAEFAATHAK